MPRASTRSSLGHDAAGLHDATQEGFPAGAAPRGASLGRTGVLLVNTGSPDAPEPASVRRYLAEFLMDPQIRPMPAVPWWFVLHLGILPRRSRVSAERYRSVWRPDGSPLVRGMERLAARVEGALAADASSAMPAQAAPRARGAAEVGDGAAPGIGASAPRRGAEGSAPAPCVRAAMCYGRPSVPSTLRELREAGCDALIVVPLYPQSASSTTAVARRAVMNALEAMRWAPEVTVVGPYGVDAAYLDAVAMQVRAAGFEPRRDQLLCSFHSIPHTDVLAGDTYPAQVRETCVRLAARLGVPEGDWTVGFQSPFPDARAWQGPFTVDALDRAACVPRRTFIVCAGFSIDCLETLYDVEQEFRARFETRAVPGAALVYVPCLNDGAAHACLMAGLVRRALDAGRAPKTRTRPCS